MPAVTAASPQIRVLLYGRTSLDRSEGRSVDDQLSSQRKWATSTGRTIIAELRDDGISASRYAGKRKSRPDWQVAMELISGGQVDELSVWEVSRSTRDRAVWAALIAACLENHVNLAVDGKVHDPADPDDGFMLDLAAALAVRESAITSKRTLRSVRSRASSGRPHGALNYGYRVEYDADTGKPIRRVIDKDQAKVIKEVARRLLAGESASSIAADLNTRGVPTPRGGEWNGPNLTRTLKSPALAGLRVHRGEVLDGVAATWKPIIKMSKHQALVAMLSDPARRSSRTGAHIRYLLPGVAECGKCGGPVRALNRKLRSGRGYTMTYACRTNFCFSRSAAETDELVEQVMIGVLSRPDITARLSAGDPEATTAGEEMARMTAKLEEARRLAAQEDGLSLESLMDLERRLLPRIADLKRAARPKHIPTVVLDTAGPDAAARWAELPVASRREIVRVLAHVKINKASRRDAFVPFDVTAVEITPRMP